ncbi:hypothetical protein ACIBTV_30695 [Micromonospora sp. NPDC049366]|uniref:hypothetical protein n=1 Tax=Micromonospora sp. NPDC049366 TaxID=3364271 RepID=UPI00379F47BC
MTPPPTPAAPQWVQALISGLAALGGASGLAAIAAVVIQRGKFKADAADTLTDAALTLVQPLRTRVSELEHEALVAREELATMRVQVQQLQAAVRTLRRTLDRWRTAVMSPDATLRRVRATVSESTEQLNDL